MASWRDEVWSEQSRDLVEQRLRQSAVGKRGAIAIRLVC